MCLMRSELTATQQAEHLAKRKELWGARNSGRNTPEKRGRPKQFAGETELATGLPKRRVNEAVARAEKVNEDIRDEIRGTGLDKGVVLDELARTEPSKTTGPMPVRRFGGEVGGCAAEVPVGGTKLPFASNLPMAASTKSTQSPGGKFRRLLVTSAGQ